MNSISSDPQQYKDINEKCFYCNHIVKDMMTWAMDEQSALGLQEGEVPWGKVWTCLLGCNLLARHCPKHSDLDGNGQSLSKEERVLNEINYTNDLGVQDIDTRTFIRFVKKFYPVDVKVLKTYCMCLSKSYYTDNMAAVVFTVDKMQDRRDFYFPNHNDRLSLIIMLYLLHLSGRFGKDAVDFDELTITDRIDKAKVEVYAGNYDISRMFLRKKIFTFSDAPAVQPTSMEPLVEAKRTNLLPILREFSRSEWEDLLDEYEAAIRLDSYVSTHFFEMLPYVLFYPEVTRDEQLKVISLLERWHGVPTPPLRELHIEATEDSVIGAYIALFGRYEKFGNPRHPYYVTWTKKVDKWAKAVNAVCKRCNDDLVFKEQPESSAKAR